MRQKSDMDRMFIGELRSHTGPVKNTLGFVRYILIPAKCPIIINWNIGSKVAEQICENDIENRKINTFKCLVSGNISLSWNEDNTIIE